MLNQIKKIFTNKFVWRKIIAYGLLLMLFFLTEELTMLFLLTFIFSYIFYTLAKYLSFKLRGLIKKENKFIRTITGINFITSILYIAFGVLIFFFISSLVPLLLKELNNLSQHMPIISSYIQTITESLKQVKEAKEIVVQDMDKLVNERNISIVSNIINHLKSFGGELFKGLLAIILSYFFIIDRKKLHRYLEGIKSSSLGFLYEEYSFLFKKVTKGFGLIFKAQAKIALTNTILTFFGLLIIGLIIGKAIPYMGLLVGIVFIFSFVPVLGVIMSSIPISLIIYNIAGIWGVLYVLIMIMIIHSIEAYVLNPRFISEAVELPVSLTFLLLLVGEHFFGPIGLIISVPLFYIIIELIGEIDKGIKEKIFIKKNGDFRP